MTRLIFSYVWFQVSFLRHNLGIIHIYCVQRYLIIYIYIQFCAGNIYCLIDAEIMATTIRDIFTQASYILVCVCIWIHTYSYIPSVINLYHEYIVYKYLYMSTLGLLCWNHQFLKTSVLSFQFIFYLKIGSSKYNLYTSIYRITF